MGDTRLRSVARRRARSPRSVSNYRGNLIYSATNAGPISPSICPVNPTTSKCVVIADDSASVRDRFRSAVESAGHRAIAVRSAAELFARVRADLDRLDLLVVDLRLPHCAGAELIRTVRKLDDGRLPILAFSGTVSSAEEVRELAALGVAGYVNEYSAVQHILPSLAPHLFPDNFNRRGSPRVVLGIPAAYHVGATIAAALSLNISRGGIAIRTTSPLEPMTKVRLRFRLPGSKKDFDIDAHVRWSDPRAGMGLQFDRVDPADQAAIDEFVDSHFFQPRRRDPAPALISGRSWQLRRPPKRDAAALTASSRVSDARSQPHRVCDDEHRCAGVGQHRHPQRRHAGDGQRQHRDLQADRQRDVGADVGQRGPAEAQHVGDLLQLVGHQRDVGALERRRRSDRAHGDADVGRGQRRRVVHPVANHRHGAVPAAQVGDGGELVRGQQPGADVVEAGRRSHRPGRVG